MYFIASSGIMWYNFYSNRVRLLQIFSSIIKTLKSGVICMNNNTKISPTEKFSTAEGVVLAFSLLLTGMGIYIDVFFTLAYGSPKFNFSLIEAIVSPLLFYIANLLLLLITAKKLNCSKLFSNLVLILDIFLRIFFTFVFYCLTESELTRLIWIFFMTAPCLSGAVAVNIIQKRKEKQSSQK